MTARLPTPGADNDIWAYDLNDFLSAGHNSDGTPKTALLAQALGWVIVTDSTYGAQGDAITLTDAAITSGTTALTSAAAAFTSADVGKTVLVAAAGSAGAPLKTTIAAYTSAVAVTLAAAAGASVSSARCVYGTDDTTAITAAYTAAAAAGKTCFLPAGKSYLVGPLALSGNNVKLVGYGATLLSTMWATDNVIGMQQYGDNIESRGFKIAVAIPYTTPQAGFGNYDIMRVGGLTAGQVYHDGCKVVDVTTDGGAGLNLYRTSNAEVTGCTVQNSHGNSIGSVNCRDKVSITRNTCYNGNDDLIAVTADSGTGQSTLRVIVANNLLDTGDASGIKIAGADRVDIVANQVRNTYTSGIMVLQDVTFNLQPSHRVAIANNVVDVAGACYGTGRLHATISTAPNGIQMTSTPADCTVTNNLVINSASRGIQINSAAGLTITDNRIITSAGTGISIGNIADTTYTLVTDLVVAGNVIRDCRGGIVAGSITNFKISDNIIRSYASNSGGTGYRGIQYAYLKRGHISDNTIVNDNAGGAPLFDSASGTSLGLRRWGNSRSVSPLVDDSVNILSVGDSAIGTAAAVPTSGTWAVGDRILNSASTLGASADWTCTTAGYASSTAWAASTVYVAGAIVYNGSNVYVVTTGGTSAGSGGPTGTSAAITDGTVTWAYIAARAAFAQPGVDQPVGSSVTVLCMANPSAVSAGTQVASGTAYLNAVRRFSVLPGTTGAYIEWKLNLAAGTWDLEIFYQSSTNMAIFQMTCGGATDGTSVDAYTASTAVGYVRHASSLVIATSGWTTIRATGTSKNASSTDYQMALSAFILTRAS